MRHHYVFVYGTLKRGFGNNVLLEDSRYVGEGTTWDRSYIMGGHGVPFVTLVHESHEDARYILGEVYYVDDRVLHRLDRLEGHPRWYERRLVGVRVLDEHVQCWMYYNHHALRVERSHVDTERDAYVHLR